MLSLHMAKDRFSQVEGHMLDTGTESAGHHLRTFEDDKSVARQYPPKLPFCNYIKGREY